MAAEPALTPFETDVLGYLRKFLRDEKVFTLTIRGSFKSGQRTLWLSVQKEREYQTVDSERGFDAVD